MSEIRRASYMYWTVEHVLTTGLIDPENKDPVTFSSIRKLIQFYSSVLKRLSRSKYEKQIVDLYLEYLKEVDEPGEVPFLIPELRYAGLEAKHLYSLDFSVLNSHTMEFMGFELSPQSSHMSVSGVKGKNNCRQGGIIIVAHQHPKEWSHGGYHEIIEPQQRYRIISRDLLKRLLVIDDDLSEVYSGWVQATVDERTPRQPGWTESVAVGCKDFVKKVKELLGGKACGRKVQEVGKAGSYALKEPVLAYNDVFEGKMFTL